MTIYTPGKVDKESKDDCPEVVTTDSEPLTGFKDKDCEAVISKPVLRVTYFPRNQKRTFCVHFVLTVMVLIILACGAIGSVIFYRHLNRKVYSGVCGVRFSDPEYQQLMMVDEGDDILYPTDVATPKAPQQIIDRYERKKPQPGVVGKSSFYSMGFTEEGMEVSEVEQYEFLHMPYFDEVRETTVWHDFKTNYSAIIDAELGACYIMPLNRSAIAPPHNIIDLLAKLMSGYYMKSAEVIHQPYKVVKQLPDLTDFGSRIMNRCEGPGYESFLVERFVSGVFKRSAGKALAYSMMSNFVDNPKVYKIYIH